MKSGFGFCLPAVALMGLAGCGYGDVVDDTPEAIPTSVAAGPQPTSAAQALPVAPAADPDGNGSPDARAARAVLGEWAAALEAKDWARAYSLWRENGTRSGMTLQESGQLFARFDTLRATVGPLESLEGAAGSLYARFPVTIAGRTVDGDRYRLAGTMTLRRVNDVDGADAADRRWGLEMNGLTSVPPPERRAPTRAPG